MTSTGEIIADRYRIEAPLGEGGMGAVFRATHLELGRTVAIKLVRAEDPSEQALERFLREAKSAASVDHRNVVDVLDFGRERIDGALARPYLVMECLGGESLEARLRRPPSPSVDEIVTWVAATLSGLAAIHDAGIIHRDLKPANVFLAEDADGIVPKVLDFGIARPTQEASSLTHTMQTLGTPHYMSPEQVRSAKTVDARSDLYAIGVILYLAVTGKLPFDGPSATAVIAAIVTDDPVPVLELRPDLPKGIAKVIHRAMARAPADRFESARAMRQALLDAQRALDPALSADRPSFTDGPTYLAGAPSGMGTPMPTPTPTPRARTGRRGFFAMLGVLSTLLVGGLAGSVVLRGSDAAPSPTLAASSTVAAVESTPTAVAPLIPGSPPSGLPARGTAGPPARDGELFRSAEGPLSSVALTVRGLGAADLASVRVATDGDAYWLLMPPRLAPPGALPAGPPREEHDRFTVELRSSTVRANVREAPSESGSLLATVPARTLVLALGPDPSAREANDGDAPGWTRVVVAEGLEGFIASSLLQREIGCVPAADAIGDPSTWISRDTVYSAGAPREALLLFDPRAGGSIRVEAVDPACRTVPIARFSLDGGQICDLFLTRTTRAGDTLIGIGRWPTRGRIPRDGTMSWTVHRLDDPERVVLALDLRSGQNLPDARRDGIGGPFEGEGDAFFPVRVRAGRTRTHYVWDGQALVPSTPNALSLPEVAE